MHYLRTAAVSVPAATADVSANADKIIEIIKDCCNSGVKLLVMPKLCISAAICGDLFFDELLLESAEAALERIIEATEGRDIIVIFGMPLKIRHSNTVCSVAAVVNSGVLLGLVRDAYIEGRSLTGAVKRYDTDSSEAISLRGRSVEIFDNAKISCHIAASDLLLNIGVGFADENGLGSALTKLPRAVDISCILGAVNSTATSSYEIKRDLQVLSRLEKKAYVLANASDMESSSDYAFAGELMISESGDILGDNFDLLQGERADVRSIGGAEAVIADIDISRISAEGRLRSEAEGFFYCGTMDAGLHSLISIEDTSRQYTRTPYLPEDDKDRSDILKKIVQLQYKALAKRLKYANIQKIVLGLSGGLDSTTALLSAVEAFDRLGYDRHNIFAIMLPCFGSTARTRSNAKRLCELLGISYRTIDIRAAVMQHFSDIGHSESNYNATFENAQARERTQVLMDLANDLNALVLGTSDLSEIALGFSTYNGDHMAMYGINSSLPKTVLRELIKYFAAHYEIGSPQISAILTDIYDTPISPELLPPDSDERVVQKTEEIIGPYELHDFFLYYFVKYHYAPKRIFALARKSFAGRYSDRQIAEYMMIFYRRFFASGFKRSCSYDAPDLLGLSLSPRAGFTTPSDSCANIWLAEVERLLEEI